MSLKGVVKRAAQEVPGMMGRTQWEGLTNSHGHEENPGASLPSRNP